MNLRVHELRRQQLTLILRLSDEVCEFLYLVLRVRKLALESCLADLQCGVLRLQEGMCGGRYGGGSESTVLRCRRAERRFERFELVACIRFGVTSLRKGGVEVLCGFGTLGRHRPFELCDSTVLLAQIVTSLRLRLGFRSTLCTFGLCKSKGSAESLEFRVGRRLRLVEFADVCIPELELLLRLTKLFGLLSAGALSNGELALQSLLFGTMLLAGSGKK
jgi:hypothetical protein